MEKELPVNKRAIPAWLIVLLVPAVSLASAYSYWSGFLSFFGVPGEMISVQPADALLAFTGLIFVLLLFYGVMTFSNNILIPILPLWIKEPTAHLVRPLSIGLLFGFALRNNKYWLVLLVIVIGFALLTYLTPLIFQRRTKGYAAKLKSDVERVQKNMSDDIFGPTIISKLFDRFPGIMIFLFYSVLFIGLSYATGIGNASSKSMFMVTNENPQRVLIATVADRALFIIESPDSRDSILEIIPANNLPQMSLIHLNSDQIKKMNGS